MKHRKTVGENIRAARKEKGWTQEKLAWTAKLDSNYVSMVERGEANISLDAIVRIAKALKVPFRELVKDVE